MKEYPSQAHDRDRKIRIAVGRLRGEQRAKAIEFYATHPEELNHALIRRLHRSKASTNFTLRLTGEDYLRLEDLANKAGMSMSRYVRMKVGL